ACGNVVLIETVQRFWDSRRGPLFERLGGHFETVDSWREAIAEHQAILDAIRGRDAAAARLAMHDHMDRSHTRFSVSWRRTKTIVVARKKEPSLTLATAKTQVSSPRTPRTKARQA
ncbi:MAG: FadR family transcriptional regulator, partial [Polaromonas sp.]|nr:FadR family transcriptional regulator [Polaromonas sp.]